MSSSPALRTVAVVGLGGAVGAVLRWLLEGAIPHAGAWPVATLLINVLGSAALALLVAHAARHPWWLRPGVGTGLLGGFTTFSTYAVQVAVVGQAHPAVAVGYLVATPLLCVAAAALVGTLVLRSGAHR
ncbi:fluoride efflux transporter FluC [Ornithinimicrobium sp. Y1694]|uniref:fluoride efflux transporter FluC n=1 Tax=Ornithinimicrobium sp. Y1694 TaxID=3418590 RepID=UPI003CE7DAA0